MKERLPPEKRKQQILDEAAKLAKQYGLYSPDFSVREIAKHTGISHVMVYRYFSGIKPIRIALIENSYHSDKVLFEMALICKDPVAKRLIENDSKGTESL